MSRAHPAGPRHGDLVAERPASPVGAPADWDPEIWPRTARVVDGELHIGGVAVSEVTAQYGTPVMIMDSADLAHRASSFREAFAGADADIYYAAKAFLASSVVRVIGAEGLGLDVCTGGELALGLRAGMPGSRMLFHGNNKDEVELAAALDNGVGLVVVDSFDELRRLSRLAAQRGQAARVLIRVTLGVEAHTHEFIATAHEDQKFGFSLASGRAIEAVGRAIDDPHIDFQGLHSHIGSQIFVASGFEVAARRAVGLMAKIQEQWGQECQVLNLGGGLGIKYVEGETPPSIEQWAAEVLEIVAQECNNAGLRMPRLAFEPGRAIIGPTTVTVYSVGSVKNRTLEGGGHRLYVSVDGGMSDNIRTALYGAEYTIVLANRESSAPPVLARVVGKHCESGDIVVRDVLLPEDIGPGDLLAVAATGAYNRSMASNYNLVCRPPVVAVSGGTVEPVLRRETLDDLFATDVGLA